MAETLRRHGYEVEHPAGRLATAIRATRARRARRRRTADRRPGRVRRAAGLGRGCGHNTMAASGVGAAIGPGRPGPTRSQARSCSSARRPEERGSGKQFMIEDGLFEGRGRGAALPPLRSEPRRLVAARIGGRRRRLPRAAGPRGRGPVAGPERPRRDDPAVQLRRAVAAAAPTDVRVHGIIQEGGTAANIIPDRTRAWFMLRSPDQARLRVDEGALPGPRRGCARSPPTRPST